ncbi:MAG: hypothetical protein H6700_03740 [Myxococcales bacterium]|nr:hypothetical protein [Myxococcales bacterium]
MSGWNETQRCALLVVSSLLVVSGCRGEVESPQTIVVQFERSVEILAGRARVALRQEGEDRVLLNVRCGDEERTLSLPLASPSPEVCGLVFSLEAMVPEGDEARTGARLEVSW